MRTILIGCDDQYYEKWGVTLIKSLKHFVPWINIHCHIVNPTTYTPMDDVTYSMEQGNSSTGYLQAVRFLKATDYCGDNLMVIDADTICTRSFTEQEFDDICEGISVLRHPKAPRWLCGLIASDNPDFWQTYASCLETDTWVIGRDQDVLADMTRHYKFKDCGSKWMKIGKPGNAIFQTLKGTQKQDPKYLKFYDNIKEELQY